MKEPVGTFPTPTVTSIRARVGILVMAFAAQFAFANSVETDWGRILPLDGAGARHSLHLTHWPDGGRLAIPTPFVNITKVTVEGDPFGRPLPFVFNEDATELMVELPELPPIPANHPLLVESVERSGQFPDGRIVFSALDASVHGDQARLESHAGNYRIGFWSNPEDLVSWEYQATRPGRYRMEVAYSLAAGESVCDIEFAGVTLRVTLPATGSWYRYSSVAAGDLYVAKAEKHSLGVKPVRKTGAAVMNLKAVTLRPIGEGNPVFQDADGGVTLHARDATLHGVKLQYEPRPIKNTIGFWVNPEDWVYWDFTVHTPGAFDIEILQGCGTGQGGSQAVVEADHQPFPFVVEDTGHFQNFVPRIIGRVSIAPGLRRISVKAIHKAKGAVMDVRQVRLIPVPE